VINISLDLGDVPSVLAAIASDSTVTRMVYVAAETYNDEIHATIRSGHSFKTQTGQLEQSIGWMPIGNNSAEVYANAKHAPFVELGTKPHLIIPKNRKALKIYMSGFSDDFMGPMGNGLGFWLRKSVKHPGFRPFPYFYRDMPQREEKMKQKMLSVLASLGASGG
jgi:hypothetical protein